MKTVTNNQTQPNQPFFTLVIPTLNESKYLPKLLACLTQQTYKKFEIIHVDGNSEDQTVEKAGSFKDKLDLTTITTKQKNAGHQRNLGGEKARGKWVIFMDADTLFKPHFLQGIKYQLDKHPNIDIFSAWLDITSYPPKFKPTILVMNFWLELSSKTKPAAFGAFLGIRKSVFDKFQFDTNIEYSEDVELVERITDQGFSYKCWDEPQYHFSFRRFEKEGFIKPGVAFIEGYMKKIINGEWSRTSDKYPMLGGGYYDEPKINIFEKMVNFFDHANKSQKQKARILWNKIVDSLDDISLKNSLKK